MKTLQTEKTPVRLPVEPVDPEAHQGLTQAQVEERREKGWQNTPSQGLLPGNREIILSHSLTFFNLIFVLLAVLLVVAGSFKNMTFLLVAIINTVIGIVQEIRARDAVEKLTLVASRPVEAIRDGRVVHIPSGELVRDDVVDFGPGDQICADAVVKTGTGYVNESLLTGEAELMEKNPGDLLRSGSVLVSGKVRVRLTQVGDDAYAAKLSREAKADPKAAKSEMMRSLDKLIRVVGIALVPIGLLLFCQEHFLLKLDFQTSTEATVAALVGMIPEGLYLLTSMAMAASALLLARRKVLVQDMNCIETLARVDVLCVDKTGTITDSHMELEHIHPLSQDPPELLESVMRAMYGGREPENETARALSELFQGPSDWKLKRQIPFDSRYKWGGAVFRDQGAFLVGAPECILGEGFDQVKEAVSEWTGRGYRVLLAAAYEGSPQPGRLSPALVRPLALLMLTNRIRPEAPDTFRYFAAQGVTVKVISGDDPRTASEVAQRAAIENAGIWVDAQTLQTQEELLEAARRCTVFGRVTPEKKKALIRALKDLGHTVAMTGDGVNDLLAMRQADCAIAMAQGAQAASQVAQLVLTESDFSAMPRIVDEGRRVINNIQRAAALFLVKNIFSLGLALMSLLTSWPYPLVPIQLTLIASLTIGIPSFFLAMEPNYERVSGPFLRTVLRRALPGGLTNLFVVLGAQAYMQVFSLTLEQTGTICTAILSMVGMLVLFQVCKPFDRFRKIIWCLMGAGLVLCFLLLPGVFDLRVGDWKAGLVLVTLVIMSYSVFTALRRGFDLTDLAVKRLRQWKEKRHGDL